MFALNKFQFGLSSFLTCSTSWAVDNNSICSINKIKLSQDLMGTSISWGV